MRDLLRQKRHLNAEIPVLQRQNTLSGMTAVPAAVDKKFINY